MRYVLITDNEVIIKTSLNKLKSATAAELTEDMFKQFGNAKVVNITNVDLKVLVDAKNFMKIPAHKLFKRDTGYIYLLPMYILMILVLLQSCTG